MQGKDKTVNAGVHNSIGIEFQKHCALYILLSNYNELKNRKYFICIESFDDFLFCYLNEDDLLSCIDTYQAKKSSNYWSMMSLVEPIKKILDVGNSLYKIKIKKKEGYTQNLNFLTNNSIRLISKKNNDNYSVIINESNQVIKYINLPTILQMKIKNEVQKLLSEDSNSIDELQNLSLAYIDLPRTSKNQKNTLVGQFENVFGDKVNNHRAAIDILILLFRDVENKLNKGNEANLLDVSKRISSLQITEAINIITKQQLVFDLWRSHKDELSKKLKIPIIERNEFEFNFENCFDYFKDLKQAEHQKILSFVKENNNLLSYSFTEPDCIENLYNEFNKKYRTQLKSIELKAAICAAYIMIRN